MQALEYMILAPVQVDCLQLGAASFEVVNDPTKAFFGFRVLAITSPQNVTRHPTINIGTNAPDYNNMLDAQRLTASPYQSHELLPLPLGAPSTIKVNVVVRAAASTYSVNFYLILYYMSV